MAWIRTAVPSTNKIFSRLSSRRLELTPTRNTTSPVFQPSTASKNEQRRSPKSSHEDREVHHYLAQDRRAWAGWEHGWLDALRGLHGWRGLRGQSRDKSCDAFRNRTQQLRFRLRSSA